MPPPLHAKTSVHMELGSPLRVACTATCHVRIATVNVNKDKLLHVTFAVVCRLASDVEACYRAKIEWEPVYYFQSLQIAAISMARLCLPCDAAVHTCILSQLEVVG